ncbi:hypothetical protein AURDEDRAFT_169254 [Auricularia subglabra TFB-10046 SS5]|nr:hypothetical protein AURDEDRAFT_169254 [Auricularia subglabra TFB-10046 SS5]
MLTTMQSGMFILYTFLHPLFPYVRGFVEALHPADWFAGYYKIYLSACTAMTANLRRHATATEGERWEAAACHVENLLAIAESLRDSNETLFQRMRAGYALAHLHSKLRIYSRQAAI